MPAVRSACGVVSEWYGPLDVAGEETIGRARPAMCPAVWQGLATQLGLFASGKPYEAGFIFYRGAEQIRYPVFNVIDVQ
jgi:hypothetical protein